MENSVYIKSSATSRFYKVMANVEGKEIDVGIEGLFLEYLITFCRLHMAEIISIAKKNYQKNENKKFIFELCGESEEKQQEAREAFKLADIYI